MRWQIICTKQKKGAGTTNRKPNLTTILKKRFRIVKTYFQFFCDVYLIDRNTDKLYYREEHSLRGCQFTNHIKRLLYRSWERLDHDPKISGEHTGLLPAHYLCFFVLQKNFHITQYSRWRNWKMVDKLPTFLGGIMRIRPPL